jgi:S1-C subfamily serine protease
MSKPTPRDSAKQPLREGVESSQQQYWIARVVPMLFVTILTIALPRILPQSAIVSELAANQEQKLQQQIRSISVKVLAHGETIGSAVLIDTAKRTLGVGNVSPQPQVYTAITNAHVIQAASAPFQLQTSDGQVYAAALIVPPRGQNRDLSILRFQSHHHIYHPAKLATSRPKIGDRVWSSGFPLDHVPATAKAAWELTIVSGRVTQILPIAISGGYSIGFDRSIRKGMSGGALIDKQGELVGINGVHANPLWETPEVLEDGSKVNDALQQQIDNSSWAIPTDFVKDYADL